jgi:hypothetical protein
MMNSNLIQGLQLLDYKNDHFSKNQKESFVKKELHSDPQYKKVNDLDIKFNRLLNEYITQLNIVNEEMVKKKDNYYIYEGIYDKVVLDADANKVYVNNYGYTHKYNNDAWTFNNKNCPQTITTTKINVGTLSTGQEMTRGQPCHIAGKNIQNKKTKEIAWVDVKGLKHKYTSNQWVHRNKTCKPKPIELTDEDFDAIPSGSDMSSNTKCSTVEFIPSNLQSNLNKLSQELLSTGKQMTGEISKLKINNHQMKQHMNEKKNKMHSVTNSIHHNHQQINYLKSISDTTQGQLTESHLESQLYYVQYLAWFIAIVTIIGITGHAVLRKS